MTRMIRSAFVIARRDFTATVLSKAFIFFLIGPMLPLLIGGAFFGIGATSERDQPRPVIATVASQQQFDGMMAARARLVEALGEEAVPILHRFDAERDRAKQQQQLLASKDPSVLAVLWLNGSRAVLAGPVDADGPAAKKLQLLLDQDDNRGARIEVVETGQSSGKLVAQRTETARAGQFILFFLTMLLATMLLSQVIEEKSNKIIEVIAAAIPMEAMFVGKLFAMLAASLVGIIVWMSAGAVLIASISTQGLATLSQPSVGWPAFLILTAVYFAMNYLTLGALFLSIGAQASTPREVQTLSMPVTILQVMVFAFAMAAVGRHGETIALAGALFPLSSPLVMIARGAELPELWPHVLALGWQILWVALVLKLGARFFRSRVLKSGPGQPLFRRSRA
jgi:ABC-2 type transport system permease protein